MSKMWVNFRLITDILEHTVFPLIFLLFAVEFFARIFEGIFQGPFEPLTILSHIRLGLLWAFHLIVAYFLFMTRHKTHVYPDQWSQILIPVVATFWFLTYGLAERIPQIINKSLIVDVEVMWVGVFLCLMGQIMSLAAILELKQSFGIVIKINEVVTSGIYRFVRHPMYLGYCMMTIGFMLMTPRPIHWLVYSMAIFLQIWRARIEERLLSDASEQYRSYCQQVPFLFPKVFKRIKAEG